MNIFYLTHDPKLCAQYHCDSHVVKMVLEYSQLLSAAHRILDGEQRIKYNNRGRASTQYILPDERDEKLYGVTHENHPSTIWARSKSGNYNWLHSLLVETCLEYEYRYERVHQSKREGIVDLLAKLPNNIKIDDFEEPPNAMPDKYKIAGDAITSYRNFYIAEKTKLLKWKKREVPEWAAKSITK